MYPGVHGDRYTAINNAQQTFALQIVDMLRMTYGQEASIVLDDGPCEGVFEEGARRRFPVQSVGVAAATGEANGTIDDLIEEYLRFAGAGLSDAELLEGMNTGAINSTAIPFAPLLVDILKETNDALLPNVSLSKGLDVQARVVLLNKITDASLLDELCSSDVVVLSVLIDVMDWGAPSVEVAQESTWALSSYCGNEAGWMQGKPCDHYVYLAGGDGGCGLGPDGDIYESYSWGGPQYLKLDQMIDGGDGLICYGAVLNVTRA